MGLGFGVEDLGLGVQGYGGLTASGNYGSLSRISAGRLRYSVRRETNALNPKP